MTHLRNIGTLAFLVVFSSATLGACGDDDDDNDNTAGRAGSSQAGTTQNEGGAGSEVGGKGGGNHGGTNTTGGTISGLGGAPAEAGAEAGGAGGNLAGAGGAADMGGAGGAGGAAAEVAALTDAQILLVLDTLNQGEVEEGYAALPRLTAANVKAFAQKMISDHGDARQEVATTADTLNLAPVPSDEEANLRAEGEAHVAIIRGTSAAALDAAYVQMEVAGHAEALQLLDELAAAADAAPLKTLITTLRATVQQHYQRAQELQAAL